MPRPILLLALLGVFVLGFLVFRHWSADQVIERQQAALIAALERRSAKHLERLLAEDYEDQWGFDREEAKLAVLDIGSQFIILNLLPVDPDYDIEGKEADVTMRFDASGNGGPMAHEIVRQVNRLEAPFVFRWKKLSFWPGDWKLVSIENPDLDAQLQGYEPGDLRRALDLD